MKPCRLEDGGKGNHYEGREDNWRCGIHRQEKICRSLRLPAGHLRSAPASEHRGLSRAYRVRLRLLLARIRFRQEVRCPKKFQKNLKCSADNYILVMYWNKTKKQNIMYSARRKKKIALVEEDLANEIGV